MSEKPIRTKRVYKTISVELIDGAYVIHLDGRQAKTQTRKLLSSSVEALAKAVAAEWDAQGEFIERTTMPFTAMLSATLDGGDAGPALWRQDILDYLGSDLLCYRADQPEALVSRQADVWDSYLGWFNAEFGTVLVVTTGITAVAQPKAAISIVNHALEKQNAETLFALRMITAITGSAVLALALWKSHKNPEDIFEASRVDELFQEERWGTDDDAKIRIEYMLTDFLTAGKFLALL